MPVLGVFGQGNPAKLYVPVQSVQGASLTNGFLIGFPLATAASLNYNAAVLLDSDGDAVSLPGFIGVANGDIADTAYGLAQCFGFCASVRISNVGTSITINAGDALVPGRAAGGGFSTAPTYANSGFKYILASNTPAAVSAATWASGYARCM